MIPISGALSSHLTEGLAPESTLKATAGNEIPPSPVWAARWWEVKIWQLWAPRIPFLSPWLHRLGPCTSSGQWHLCWLPLLLCGKLSRLSRDVSTGCGRSCAHQVKAEQRVAAWKRYEKNPEFQPFLWANSARLFCKLN